MNEKQTKENSLDGALMQLRFQNYNPRSEELQKYCEETTSADDILRKVIDAQEASIAASNKRFSEASLDVDNMIPKKGNWDIKRSLSTKLERLDRRTQRAILDMARLKLQKSGNLASGGDQLEVASSDEEQ